MGCIYMQTLHIFCKNDFVTTAWNYYILNKLHVDSFLIIAELCTLLDAIEVLMAVSYHVLSFYVDLHV